MNLNEFKERFLRKGFQRNPIIATTRTSVSEPVTKDEVVGTSMIPANLRRNYQRLKV